MGIDISYTMKEAIKINDLQVEYDDIRRGRVVPWGHGAGVYVPKTWLGDTVIVIRLKNCKEVQENGKTETNERRLTGHR